MANHSWPHARGGPSDPNYFYRRAFALEPPTGGRAHRRRGRLGRWVPPLVPELPFGSFYVSYPGTPISP